MDTDDFDRFGYYAGIGAQSPARSGCGELREADEREECSQLPHSLKSRGTELSESVGLSAGNRGI